MKRLYTSLIVQHFQHDRQMLFLAGPRQVGKTTACLDVAQSRPTNYLNWDNFDHQRDILAGPARLAEILGLDRLNDEVPLAIFDEIHKYPRWRHLLKGFFDTYGNALDLLVTGSARLDLFNRGGESLMGRYFLYRMHPLSVAELVEPRESEAPGTRKPVPVADDFFEALFRFGGFPEPLLRQSDRFARRWQRLRLQQLLREELRDLTRIQDVTKVQHLAQLLIYRVGQLTSYSSLANEVDASIDSIKRWLDALESLYFCFRLRPWSRNVARSLRKEPKFYLWDAAMVEDPGARSENLVASALLKAAHLWTDHGHGTFELFFLRDKEKREVDFLLCRDHEPWILVEVKNSGERSLSKNLPHFQRQLKAPLALQVAWDLPYVDRDCFALERPMIVPARTLLSQLV